ncbi:hypothetical protein KRX54_05545 [Actinomycetaceae bacterium TAE3-ERU4]|nr:hypothetical protein [Actinomycetaceae bacterium TAE3-ERU4]
MNPHTKNHDFPVQGKILKKIITTSILIVPLSLSGCTTSASNSLPTLGKNATIREEATLTLASLEVEINKFKKQAQNKETKNALNTLAKAINQEIKKLGGRWNPWEGKTPEYPHTKIVLPQINAKNNQELCQSTQAIAQALSQAAKNATAFPLSARLEISALKLESTGVNSCAALGVPLTPTPNPKNVKLFKYSDSVESANKQQTSSKQQRHLPSLPGTPISPETRSASSPTPEPLSNPNLEDAKAFQAENSTAPNRKDEFSISEKAEVLYRARYQLQTLAAMDKEIGGPDYNHTIDNAEPTQGNSQRAIRKNLEKYLEGLSQRIERLPHDDSSLQVTYPLPLPLKANSEVRGQMAAVLTQVLELDLVSLSQANSQTAPEIRNNLEKTIQIVRDLEIFTAVTEELK